MEETQVVPRNVSLYPEDWAIVRQVAKDTGQRSISGGLRAIIAEYVRMKAQRTDVSVSTEVSNEQRRTNW